MGGSNCQSVAGLLLLDQTCIVRSGAKRVVVATLSGKQRCGRCGFHGCREIRGTLVVGRSGPTGVVDPQRPVLRSGRQSCVLQGKSILDVTKTLNAEEGILAEV